MQRRRVNLSDVIPAGLRPERVADDVAITRAGDRGSSQVGGFVRHGRPKRTGPFRVVEICVPDSDTAAGRVTRAHELLHAAHSPAKRRSYEGMPDMVAQAIEDCRVHSEYWKGLDHLRRDVRWSGWRDVRDAARVIRYQWAHDARALPVDYPPLPNEAFNVAIVQIVRGAMILRHGAGNFRSRQRLRKYLRQYFGAAAGNELHDVIERICDQVRTKKWEAAGRAIEALMRWDPPSGEGEGDEDGDELDERIGRFADSPMRIRMLDLVEPAARNMIRRRRAAAGSRFSRRMIDGLVSRDPSGMFETRIRRAGGVFLIDASGSMKLSDEGLRAILEAAPAATVAYYSGDGIADENGCIGDMVVYARGGRRARIDPGKALPYRENGNEVDAYAIDWAVRESDRLGGAPITIVTDMAFCGGPAGQAARAYAMTESLVQSGRAQVIGKLPD